MHMPNFNAQIKKNSIAFDIDFENIKQNVLTTKKEDKSPKKVEVIPNVEDPNEEQKEQTLYKCPHCDRKFKREAYAKHVPVCARVFTNNKNIENNKEDKLENNDNNISENIYNVQIKEFNNKDEKLSQNVVNFDLKNYNQVCNYCHIRTFIRATHCLVCDECILFKQEHCQYIANCIGFNNIQYFINFLFWCICGLIFYSFFFIKFFFNFDYNKIGISVTSLIISNFIMNLMILIMLINKLYKLFKNIFKNVTQYEQQMEENEKMNLGVNINSNNYKEHNLFNIGFLSHLYYIIGPTPFHFFLPLPKIKTYGNDENCPVFLKCKFPNRLELIKYLAKKDQKYKDLLNDVESDPNNYIKLCHDYYDDKYIE